MPSFCRHNRLLQNCPICTREQAVDMRPVVSSGTAKASEPRPAREASRGETRARSATSSRSSARLAHGGMRVRRLARGEDDGFRTALAPGLRSSADAERLADELAFAAGRLAVLETEPPGLYAEVADGAGDVEERAWLAFQIAYLSPLEDAEQPFAGIDAVRTSWASGALPELGGVRLGPRTAHEPARGDETLRAYRAWASRAGSQGDAFAGEAAWTPERRFDRVFERLALPGLGRDARYELLVSLGRLGVFKLRGGRLHLVGENEPTVAAKRVFGIGDAMLLERRAAELAAACRVPVEALDLGLFNWGVGVRAHSGLAGDEAVDGALVESCREALGL
ncbi:MAG TPA: hypothetical protein VFP55_06995 [Solirubrobacteraceae bacterium]|nr:hypothetical protein [Solirubrobacteraceae bacterium]